jgi:hypothetical protein
MDKPGRTKVSTGLPYPSPESLQRSLTRVSELLDRPLGDYLDEDSIGRIAFTKNRSSLASAIRRHLGGLDKRIRFVAATKNDLPSGTIKLINIKKAEVLKQGVRLRELLDGGFIAVTAMKNGSPSDWQLTSMYTFMPEGRLLKESEAALQKLVEIYRRDKKLSHIMATDAWPFQMRTGPGGYWIYFLAQRYFAQN